MLKNTFTTKKIVLMGLLVAISAVLAQFTIVITPQQRIGFSFLPLAIGAVVLGPIPALLMGFAADTINYLIKPMGAYFPGYALSLMLSCLIYSLWQYNKPLKLWRIICAQLCNVVCIYFGLNFVWQTILYGTAAASFFSGLRLIVNAAQLPIVVTVVFMLSRAVNALMSREKA